MSKLKAKLKGNMCLLHAKQLVWHEIIDELKYHLDYLILLHEQKAAIKKYEFTLLSNRDEGKRNYDVVRKYF